MVLSEDIPNKWNKASSEDRNVVLRTIGSNLGYSKYNWNQLPVAIRREIVIQGTKRVTGDIDDVYNAVRQRSFDKSKTKLLSDLSSGKIQDGLKRGLDPGIESYIAAINVNPNVMTTGSCSGHDGHPYLQVVFRTQEAKNYYVQRLKSAGLKVVPVVDTGTTVVNWYIDLKGTDNQESGYVGPASKSQSANFWKVVTSILQVRGHGSPRSTFNFGAYRISVRRRSWWS